MFTVQTISSVDNFIFYEYAIICYAQVISYNKIVWNSFTLIKSLISEIIEDTTSLKLNYIHVYT